MVLQMPNRAASFDSETDASLTVVGALLIQHDGHTGNERPVTFSSQTLTGTQGRYSTFESELVAVMLVCEAYRVFLLGITFTLNTDHRALWESSRRSREAI